MSTKLFINHFTALDYAYFCPERGLLGESYYVSAELNGDLDEQGFLMDFSKVKKLLKSKVDELLDHKVLVPTSAPGFKGNAKSFSFSADEKDWTYSAPAQATVFFPWVKVTSEHIENFLAQEIQKGLSQNIKSVRIYLEAEAKFSSDANFRYTHGLKLHEGNCQRLFHGHRNLIEVFVHGKKSALHEQELAKLYRDVHFTAAENVKNIDELDLPLETRQLSHPGTAAIAYRSNQGEFFADLPASQIMLIDSEPSIENIALMSKRILERKYPGSKFTVRAYEGLQKGASAE